MKSGEFSIPFFEEINFPLDISNIITKKEKVLKAYSHNRSGSQLKDETINENKYELYLVHKNNGRSQLVSGTAEKVKEFCKKMLELSEKKQPTNIYHLLSSMGIKDIVFDHEDEKKVPAKKPRKMSDKTFEVTNKDEKKKPSRTRTKPSESTNKGEKLITRIKRRISEIDRNYSISWNEIPNSNEAGKQKMTSKNNYNNENGHKKIEKRFEFYLVHTNGKKSLLVAGTEKECKEYFSEMLDFLEKSESRDSEELLRLLDG